jgi:hypothetical protein
MLPEVQDLLDVVRDLAARVEALEEAENDRRFEAAKVLIDRPTPAALVQPEPVAYQDKLDRLIALDRDDPASNISDHL